MEKNGNKAKTVDAEVVYSRTKVQFHQKVVKIS
jgi:hypothetical protein